MVRRCVVQSISVAGMMYNRVNSVTENPTVADPKIDLSDAKFPTVDGDINEYVSKEALASGQFDRSRKVVFVNGMLNSGENHAESALALSLLLMGTVVGVYNATVNGW